VKQEREKRKDLKQECMQFTLNKCIVILLAMVPAAPSGMVWGEIGGKTAEDGIFVLDDAEDLDLVANGVDRPWIPDFVQNGGLSAIFLENHGNLTLAEDQTPVGALRFRVPSYFGFIDKSFGVPMPSVPGQSTIPFPGDISDFAYFEFLLAFTPEIPEQQFWLILETYPERSPNVFPRIMWRYYPVAGTTFQRLRVPIHKPTLILDGDGYTLDELLSQTRFFSIYFFAQVQFPTTFNAYIDDITLVPPDPPQPGAGDLWMMY